MWKWRKLYRWFFSWSAGTAGKGRVEVRPIAGTRHRGTDEKQDLLLEKDLRNDPRNWQSTSCLLTWAAMTIGRIARMGTVKVDELMVVERYSQSCTWSRMSAARWSRPGCFWCIPRNIPGRDCFRRSENQGHGNNWRAWAASARPVRRAVGYFSFSGNMDFCITIRTMLIKNKKIFVQAGAGIVADSKPDREYQETVNKALGMFKAIQKAQEGIENALMMIIMIPLPITWYSTLASWGGYHGFQKWQNYHWKDKKACAAKKSSYHPGRADLTAPAYPTS